MKNKHILNIHALVMDKGKTPELPDNVVVCSTHINSKYLDDYFLDYVKVDFRKQKLLIVYIDPYRQNIKCNAIFKAIKDISGVTKSQIKGKNRKKEIVFMRQLFHYGFMECKIGSLAAAAEQTNNKQHATVLNSLRIIKYCIEVDKSWRKELYNKFIKELINKDII